MLLLSYGVPYHVVAVCSGRNAMFWYRLERSLGRNSVVGTTVRDPEPCPDTWRRTNIMPGSAVRTPTSR